MSDAAGDDLWQRVEAAVPRDLLIQIKIHRQFYPDRPLPEKLHRAVAAALARTR